MNTKPTAIATDTAPEYANEIYFRGAWYLTLDESEAILLRHQSTAKLPSKKALIIQANKKLGECFISYRIKDIRDACFESAQSQINALCL